MVPALGVGGHVERRVGEEVLHVGVGPALEQHLDQLHVVVARRCIRQNRREVSGWQGQANIPLLLI